MTRRVAAVLVAVLAAAGCGGGDAGGGTADATVTVSVQASYTAQTGPGCATADGYDDIGPGTVLVLAGETGDVVDRAELGDGQLVTEPGNGRKCRFEATFDGIPDDRDAEYVITSSSRPGEVLATGAELFAGGVVVVVGS